MTVTQFMRATGATMRDGWKGSVILRAECAEIVWRAGVYGGAIVTYVDGSQSYHSNPAALREVAEALREREG